MFIKPLGATGLGVLLAVGIGVSSPALAIQNIGFPDDSRIVLGAAEFSSFSAAQKALDDALATLAKFDGIDGESTRVKTALQSIQKNADLLESMAAKAGNPGVAGFMSTIKSWSISGDADDRPTNLVKKIQAAVAGLELVKK